MTDPTAIASEYAQRHGWYVSHSGGVATVPLDELGRLVDSRGAEVRAGDDLADALAYALARADLPGPMDTSRDYAERLAPLVLESGYLAERNRGADLRAAAQQALDLLTMNAAEYHKRYGEEASRRDGDLIDALTAALAPEPQGGLQPTPEPRLTAEKAALEAGTHEPAVDDFGNQYLSRIEPARPTRGPFTMGELRDALERLQHADGDTCTGLNCTNPDHGWLEAEAAAAPPSSDAGSPIDVDYAALAADGTVDPKRYHLDPIHHAIVHRVYQGKPPRAAISDAGLSHPGDCPESLRPHDPGTADGCVELTKP